MSEEVLARVRYAVLGKPGTVPRWDDLQPCVRDFLRQQASAVVAAYENTGHMEGEIPT